MTLDPRRSARLVYRAVELSDEDFLRKGNDDSSIYQVSPKNASVFGKKDVTNLLDFLMNKALIAVVICLAPAENASTVPTTLIPIGSMSLSPVPPEMRHHRFTGLGIKLLPEHRGKGYGSEAITWILGWAFDRLGLHRVQLDAFEWNEGARKLYERLGFTLEGRSRELLFHEGKFWDEYHFSMLESEYRQKRDENQG
ncbi:hypothetical protein B9Z65_6605 [Elsinoe australis]|uniref:N-acetyltransferase domain-containing protein n=1 Tax=Elsinoe australis TaxID=40998 RepID=A0A2P8ADP8_9PEZI|nr:hypothetical protein B9Z65_6605 [Elsinoe australis]